MAQHSFVAIGSGCFTCMNEFRSTTHEMLNKKNWTTSRLAQNHTGRLQQAAQQSALLSLQTLYLKAIFHLLHSNFLCRKMFCSTLIEITLQWLHSLMAKTGLWFYPVYRSAREHKHSFLQYLLSTMKLLQSGTCSFCGSTLPWTSNVCFFFFSLIFIRSYSKRNVQTEHHSSKKS